MRQPYETLLGHYHTHWSMAPHLKGREPNFTKLFASELFDSLSASEQKMLHISLAIYNGDREATIADLAGLDRFHLVRVMIALYLCTVSRLGAEEMQGFQAEWEAMVHGAKD